MPSFVNKNSFSVVEEKSHLEHFSRCTWLFSGHSEGSLQSASTFFLSVPLWNCREAEQGRQQDTWASLQRFKPRRTRVICTALELLPSRAAAVGGRNPLGSLCQSTVTLCALRGGCWKEGMFSGPEGAADLLPQVQREVPQQLWLGGDSDCGEGHMAI